MRRGRTARRPARRGAAAAAVRGLLHACVFATLLPAATSAQQYGPGNVSARALAPVDLTGYWVSIVHEDWAWRMRTPPVGDYASVPLNDEGRRVADQWTVEQDGSCLAHGAAAALRMPTRVHVTWADDDTLRIDIDNGMQTRLLHFDSAAEPPAERTLQGHSVARWTTGGRALGRTPVPQMEALPWATLEVVTTRMQPAWLRPNGVPYSGNAVLTEYFDAYSDLDDDYFTVTTMVDDPAYLTEQFVVSSNFRREPDGSSWNPTPCDD